MRAPTALLFAALLLAIAPPAHAGSECGGQVVDVAGNVYIVTGGPYGPTVYLESNGEAGLQCAGHENPDMQLY